MKNYVLWENGAPGFDASIGLPEPSIDAYILPGEKKRGAIIVCPGGGYNHLEDTREGTAICEFFNTLGMNAFTLHYRVAPYHYPIELWDIQRAVRYIRKNADELKVYPDKIGVLGFSAGGHLCTMAIEHFDYGLDTGDEIDRVSCRPDFSVLCYSASTLGLPFSARSAAKYLIGEDANEEKNKELLRKLSGEASVPDDCTPSFLWHTCEDKAVPVINAVVMAQALSEKKIPYELHIFPHGHHGLDLAKGAVGVERWTALVDAWLKDNSFID